MSMPAARLSNANVYERLGIRTIVNASGPSTRLSGGIMRPEVAAAMAEASQWCVDLAEVQGRASEILAEATGAEAGYVTAGASAALMLASAACLAGFDPAKMNRLPDTTGMANEVVVARSQRNMYDRAVAQAGARLVEVGIPDRFSGAGVRDAQSWEYEAAINDKTAAILWVAQDHSEPSLPEIVTLARRHKLPVIVDAAGQLPPAENLKRFVAEGAGLYLDYSKNRLTDETIRLLVRLADACSLRERIKAMFSGEKINTTEDRAVCAPAGITAAVSSAAVSSVARITTPSPPAARPSPPDSATAAP